MIDRKAGTDVPQEVDVVEVVEPIGVVYNQRLAVRKVDEAGHLTSEAIDVMLDCFLCEHAAHVGTTRGVAHHCRAAADKRYRAVPRALHVRHCHKRYKVPYVQAVRSRVVTCVEGYVFLAQ